MGLAAKDLTLDTPAVIERLLAGVPVTRDELKQLLSLTHVADIQLLFAAARAARSIHFGKNIFLYGFLYFSTHCRNNCSFCQYRKANTKITRYRKDEKMIRSAAKEMAAEGIHLIDLTMGEDPLMFSSGSSSLRHFGNIVMEVRADTQLPTMISPGVLPAHLLKELAREGIEWYACYQETHNQQHFHSLRPGQSYSARLSRKRLAKNLGMLVEEGILLGTGENLDDVIDSMYFMRHEGMDQVRAMTYVPQPGITIHRVGENSSLRELLTIAVMRLLMPDRLLPASLDVDGLEGLKARLNAGANVITSIVPPARGLAGVVNKSLDIEESRRTLAKISPIVKRCGLEMASQQTYDDWVATRQAKRCISLTGLGEF